MYKAVIFDLDGTLVDTMDSLTKAINMMRAELGYEAISRDKTLLAINYGIKRFVRDCLPEDVKNNEAVFERAYAIYCEKYETTHLDVEEPYGHVYELLDTLKKMGVKLAVISNKKDNYTVGICKKLFSRHLDEARGQRDGAPAKPDPTVPLEICKNLGVETFECLYVGDSDVDMITARNCGFTPIGVSWGYRDKEILLENGAKTVIDDPLEILEFFNV